MKKLLVLAVCFLLCVNFVGADDITWDELENRLHQLVIDFANYRKTNPDKTEIFEIDKESGFLYRIMYSPFERMYYTYIFLTYRPSSPDYPSFPNYLVQPEQRQVIKLEAANKFNGLYGEPIETDDKNSITGASWYCTSSWYNFANILRHTSENIELIGFLVYESSLQ